MRKAAKRTAAEAAVEVEAVETDPAEAKRLRKTAKWEAAVAAAEEEKGDHAEAKLSSKVAKHTSLEEAAAGEVAAATEECDWFEPATRTKLTKTQRKAKKRDAAAAEIAASALGGAPNAGKGKGESGKSEGESSKDKGESCKSKGKSGKSKGKGAKSKDNGIERNDELTVFVANLPFTVKGPSLRQHFEECGQIDRFMLPMVDMVRQLYPKGIAFVQYATKEALQKALVQNETEYCGRVITVQMAGQGGKSGKAV